MAAGRFHVIYDVSQVSHHILVDEEALDSFLKRLPALIGMSILKGPEIVIGTPDNPGITGFVIINFSHISIHTFTVHKQALVDIFSCKPYSKITAENAVLEYFNVDRSNSKIQTVSWE